MRLERLKTIALMILVGTSLILSVEIWTYAPQSTGGDSPKFYGLPDPTLGPVKTINQVVGPEQVVVHLGGGKHTVLRPFDITTVHLLDTLKGLSVQPPVMQLFSYNDWVRTIHQKGFELDFGLTLSAGALHQLFSFVTPVSDSISAKTVYVTQTGPTEWKIILFTNMEQPAYTARVTVQASSVDALLAQFAYAPLYKVNQSLGQSYYLPVNPIRLSIQQRKRVEGDSDHLARLFFVDPFVAKRVSEVGKVVAYTDGSRGVTVNQSTGQLTYEGPTITPARPDTPVTVEYQLQQILDFVHVHGDFPGDMIARMADSNWTADGQNTYSFRQYIQGLPVISSFGTADVAIEYGDITSMTRSVNNIGTIAAEQQVSALSQDELFSDLQSRKIPLDEITNVQLVYIIENQTADLLQLRPAYMIVLRSRTIVIDAVTGEVVPKGGVT